ncbi:hypothetical protein FA95DRAFT_992148 [Auriscalpium vulgare]|uniref:Uncharacterized protein n=1 Tax=Auriscalpium vulgare TaxID=40419 RepID=A0ACB8R6G5_9AGAM|nr:hypothetical protein FA95DRAFT_992148 [Auriscalpium vulgare]
MELSYGLQKVASERTTEPAYGAPSSLPDILNWPFSHQCGCQFATTWTRMRLYMAGSTEIQRGQRQLGAVTWVPASARWDGMLTTVLRALNEIWKRASSRPCLHARESTWSGVGRVGSRKVATSRACGNSGPCSFLALRSFPCPQLPPYSSIALPASRVMSFKRFLYTKNFGQRSHVRRRNVPPSRVLFASRH